MNLICYKFCCSFCIDFLNERLFQSSESEQTCKQGDFLCVDQEFVLLRILNIFKRDLWVKVKLKCVLALYVSTVLDLLLACA